MTIAELSKQIHENARNKGFWDKERNMGEMLMLIVFEVSEAMEADRKSKFHWDKTFDGENVTKDYFESYMKGTFEDELADIVIRVFDLAFSREIDLEWYIRQKMRYNETRPHMHGKKY